MGNSLQMVWVFIMNRMSSQSSSSSQRRRMALGIVILLLVDVIWVASSELTSSEPLYVPVKFHDLPTEKSGSNNSDAEKTPKKPRVRFSNIMEIRQLPSSHALEAKLSRMSYPTVKEQESLLKTVGKLTATQVAKISFFFCFVWFLANFSYQEALSDTQVAIVNILSSTSGSLWSLVGAMLYAVYIVMIKRKVDREDKLDIPMFFGFVGLFNLLLLWPGFFLLHYTGFEAFEFPSKLIWMCIVINGLIGTVLSEFLWLWGCFLTSSLIGTLALSLTIPLSIIADMCMQKIG
ncbi:hypothetical protein ASZ78_002805 [Callipepla squamata]|uniref:EamA domain-containing protein n=1 Tax=Callipepla squamata TaxID=9009 RepID=A0A226NJ94_CALSU|nr:hypothetical protein ASZ78_002805 [Callipepla squamata]